MLFINIFTWILHNPSKKTFTGFYSLHAPSVDAATLPEVQPLLKKYLLGIKDVSGKCRKQQSTYQETALLRCLKTRIQAA